MTASEPAPVAVPRELVEGFAETWTRLAGGRWEAWDVAAGRLVLWLGPSGPAEALPDRMYGLVEARAARLGPDELPRDVAVNLPPGVSVVGAQLHCLGHQLVATDEETAWGSLRRVGRQGVGKARRCGLQAGPVSDSQYLRLATLKAQALGGRPPHPQLVETLRAVFGPERVGIIGALGDAGPAACVLWLALDGYGMLVDGASDRAQWGSNPNNLAVWEAVSSLVRRGCTRVDYGFSPPGAGDARFKDHMGGREVPLYRLPLRDVG